MFYSIWTRKKGWNVHCLALGFQAPDKSKEVAKRDVDASPSRLCREARRTLTADEGGDGEVAHGATPAYALVKRGANVVQPLLALVDVFGVCAQSLLGDPSTVRAAQFRAAGRRHHAAVALFGKPVSLAAMLAIAAILFSVVQLKQVKD
ncbi:hypothetical protein [Chromobacterium haemolyticum]|uniref:hypothetical protein n=1 Tax=Chromobacterium haemolyticum TaxID=394935 RepID=UPI000DEF33C5|nr:hypothetical protein [Chromobacterium haemolyticum]